MQKTTQAMVIAALVAAGYCGGAMAQSADKKMNFFVTSTGPGKGADLGGLGGADKHCQSLAAAAGAGNKQWRAYLSTSDDGGKKLVNARDRIGRGPWYNAKGEMIAKDLDSLHSDQNKLTQKTALNEKGGIVNGRAEKPNMHDILTGSDSHGRAFAMSADTTCGNWTKSGAEGSANVGHHDREGLSPHLAAKSWNHSHGSRGCSQEALRSSGGNGLFYCFAAK
ncbi:MAG: hypothetical protein ACKVQK_27425 [Burkholderiales bacterium]